MRSSACVMRLRTPEAALTASSIWRRCCSWLRSTSISRCAACCDSDWRWLRSCCALATSAAAALQHLLVGREFVLQALQLAAGAGGFGFGGGGARGQFGATLFVVAPARRGPLHLQMNLVQPFARLLGFGVDGVALLGALGVLGVHRLHGLGAEVQTPR